MDIYKLKDFDNTTDSDASSDLGENRITDIKQAVKNENRVNVFVNGKYSFSLDISQLVDFHLKKGQVISAEQLVEYKKASEFGKMYQRTLEWVLTRPRSVRETRDYLRRKLLQKFRGPFATNGERVSEARPVTTGESERVREKLQEFSSKIISRLVDKGYLDDRRFAEYYVENRFVKKGISQKRLKMELMKKGVPNEIIAEVLDGRNDEEEILKMITKKRAKYDDEKLTAYLCRQGFPYELVQNLVRSYGKD